MQLATCHVAPAERTGVMSSRQRIEFSDPRDAEAACSTANATRPVKKLLAVAHADNQRVDSAQYRVHPVEALIFSCARFCSVTS